MANQEQAHEWLQVYQGLSERLEGKIEKAQGILTDLYDKCVDRLIGLATQFTILFLTGWVALLAASKLDVAASHRILIGLCCLLHLISLVLLVTNQWFVMVSYDKRSRDLLKTRELANSGSIQIQSWIVANSTRAAEPDFRAKVASAEAEYLKPFHDHENASARSAMERNDLNWKVARWALGFFFASVLASLSGMIALVR